MLYVRDKEYANEKQVHEDEKNLIEQMNAEALRQSLEYHEQQELELREEARKKFEQEQQRIAETELEYLNTMEDPLNVNPNHNFMTDEELARLLQEEEYINM